MTIQIRLATTGDIDTIFDIRTSVKENHLSRQQLAQLGITPQTIAQAMSAAPCLWIAEINGKPAGFAMVDVESGNVFAAFVHPQYEGQGIGRSLMAQAEAFLFERHETLWLETDGQSRASGFYRKLGWRPVQTFDNGDIRFEKTRHSFPSNQTGNGQIAD